MGYPKGFVTGRCAVCKHPERLRAELLIAGGASQQSVCRKFGLSVHAMNRHWRGHVSPERKAMLLVGPLEHQALASQVAEEASSVIDHFKAIRSGL